MGWQQICRCHEHRQDREGESCYNALLHTQVAADVDFTFNHRWIALSATGTQALLGPQGRQYCFGACGCGPKLGFRGYKLTSAKARRPRVTMPDD